ncbi:hypothetical protein ACFVZY_18410, partial [Streptomyces mirabilis]
VCVADVRPRLQGVRQWVVCARHAGRVDPPRAGAPPQRVAQLEERIAILTDLRDSLVRRMPWLAAPDGTADEQAA